MDGERLSQDLNYMVFSWESKYERNDKLLKKLGPAIPPHNWDSEITADQNEDTISPVIGRHILEIEQEIQRINKEKEDKKIREQNLKEEQQRQQKLEEQQRQQKLEEQQRQKLEEQQRQKLEEQQRQKPEEQQRQQKPEEQQRRQKPEEQQRQQKPEEQQRLKEGQQGSDFNSFQEQGKRYIEMVTSYQSSSEYKEVISSTESSMKSTRMHVKKTIQLSINQISSTRQQILSSSKRIKELLSELRSSPHTRASPDNPSPVYTYGLYMTASLFIDQCRTQISAFPDSVWSYAYSCLYILEENADFESFLEGLMFTECRVLHSSSIEDLSAMGGGESEEDLGRRLNSMVRFYLSVNILRGNFGKIWLWFVRLLNRESSHILLVYVVLAVMQVAPHFFFSQFRSQFAKIIDYILRFKLPRMYALVEGNPFPIKGQCKQLEAILGDLKSSSPGTGPPPPPPNGFVLKDKHLDVEC